MTKMVRSFFRLGQRSGHQRSPKVKRFVLQRSKTMKIAVFLLKRFFSNNFWLSKGTASRDSFFQCRIYLLKTRRINYNLTLKDHFENLTSGQGHDLIGKDHVAYRLIRMVSLNTSMVFSSLWMVSIKSYCQKTAGDLSWPEMTLASWRGVTGRNIPN